MLVKPTRDTKCGYPHRLGDGYHRLPVQTMVASEWKYISSVPCVLLLFLQWAHERQLDAVAIDRTARARTTACPPDARRPFRPDQLMVFARWLEAPDRITLNLLAADLQSIGADGLLSAIHDVDRGQTAPPPSFTHWLVTSSGEIAGEARRLEPAYGADEIGQHHCQVRRFDQPMLAEWGYVDTTNLRLKSPQGM